jgi:hypothetical protein
MVRTSCPKNRVSGAISVALSTTARSEPITRVKGLPMLRFPAFTAAVRRLVAVAVCLGFAGQVSAAPITTFGGAFFTGNFPTPTTVDFTDGSSGPAFPSPSPSGFAGSSLSTFELVLGSWSSSTSGPATITGGSFTLTGGAGSATFTFVPGSTVTLTNNNQVTGQIGLIAQVDLTANTTGFNLSDFLASNGGGNFNFTANGLFVKAAGASTEWENPGASAITGSFTLTANSVLGTVPEPATLALFGAGAGLFGLYFTRRGKQPRPA